MHLVIGRIVGFDRQKCTGADMERHEMSLDACSVQRRKQLRREMQASGRSCDGAFLPGIDGLVVLPVAIVLGPLVSDIGRQRDVPYDHDRLVERRSGEIKQQGDFTPLALCLDRCVQSPEQTGIAGMAEGDAVADPDTLARSGKCLPAFGAGPHVKGRRHRKFVATLPDPLAFELRRDDFRVVENQRVAGPEEAHQVGHAVIGKQRLAIGPDDEQPCTVARAGRPQRNILLRQIEIEQINAH